MHLPKFMSFYSFKCLKFSGQKPKRNKFFITKIVTKLQNGGLLE